MAENDQTPHGWQRDERGDLYRLLTSSERAQIALAEKSAPTEIDEGSGGTELDDVESAA